MIDPKAAEVEAGAIALQAELGERKRIARFLAYRAARAMYRYTETPWWNLRQLARYRWTMTMHVTTMEDIERGMHCEEQADWLINIGDGELLDRAMVARLAAAHPSKGE